MKIVLVEPFYGGSHKRWCDGYKKYSRHEIRILSLPARYWKWRMHGGAVTLANRFLKEEIQCDLIIASDFLHLPLFRSLLHDKVLPPTAVYYHENQITYPWSPDDEDVESKRDRHYGFINYMSALTAKRVLFNSNYHKNSFHDALPKFLSDFPDFNLIETLDEIHNKSEVWPLGMELNEFAFSADPHLKSGPAVILWNHRWEYDKNPEDFFKVVLKLKNDDVPFKLVVLGEKSRRAPEVFEDMRIKFEQEILHWGYCENRSEYVDWVQQSDILPVTAYQDFFGGSVVEAIFAGVWPLLPNRLAYPEHFDGFDARVFYNDNSDLYQKLKDACIHIDRIRSATLNSRVGVYNWNRMAGIYDDRCVDLITRS